MTNRHPFKDKRCDVQLGLAINLPFSGPPEATHWLLRVSTISLRAKGMGRGRGDEMKKALEQDTLVIQINELRRLTIIELEHEMQS